MAPFSLTPALSGCAPVVAAVIKLGCHCLPHQNLWPGGQGSYLPFLEPQGLDSHQP